MKMLSSIFGLAPKPKTMSKPVFQVIHIKKLTSKTVPVKEIQIPTKWGHIAAKLWGNENQRPILALHGWQDNAGTWDPLAPMLTEGCSILAVDLPGHGLSAWYPPGMHYYPWDLPRMILDLKEHFKWNKVTLLCHSLGSIAGLRYASLFPDDVDGFVAIENLIYDDCDLDFVIDKYGTNLIKVKMEQSRLDTEPTSYSLEEIKNVWHLGTRKSVSLDAVDHLLKRGVKQSKKDPNKYYFSRDGRLKYMFFGPEGKEFVESIAIKLKSPTLHIKGTDSPYGSNQFSVEMREVVAKNNDKYELQLLPGTHHLHLNNPEKIAFPVISFLKKYNIYKE